MVVKLTQEQHEFLETFGYKKNKACYYISRWGWGHNLTDGNGKVYDYDEKTPFEQSDIREMLNAVINGYEVLVTQEAW